MPADKIRGIVPILITPFDEDGRVDEISLRNLVEFNIAADVHGLGVALGSEIFKLSDSEREIVVKCVVKAVRGRVPVVINTGASGTDVAVQHSKSAQDLGADALMVLPPTFLPVPPDGVVEYYRQISKAVRLPIFLQDAAQGPIPAGTRAADHQGMRERQIHQGRNRARNHQGQGDGRGGRVVADRIWRRRRHLPDRGTEARRAGHHALWQPAVGVR